MDEVDHLLKEAGHVSRLYFMRMMANVEKFSLANLKR